MGASQSTPPPLVQVSAPRGKVLVPPGTAFTVHPPPPYSRSRSDSYARGSGGPVFVPTPYGPFPRGPCGGRHVPRYGGGTDIEIAEGSEDSDSTVGDVAEATRPRGSMRGQGPKGYAGDTPMMGGRRGGGYGRFDAFESRPRSAPEVMPMGGYPPNMSWSMPIGGVGGAGGGAVPGDPRMGGAGMVGGPLPPFGIPPPEYTSNPNLARFSGDGTVPAAGVHPCANYVGPSPPSPPSSSSTSLQQPTPRTAASGRPHHDYDRVPMGAFADMAKKPPRTSRAHTDPQTSARLNRGQTLRKVGPSGKEWLEGDVFLDACICTTNCSCRKGQRVLYRARADGHKASDSDGEGYEYRSGEIRYVLKDDLGRDCGDHSGCRKGGETSDSDKDSKRSKRKAKKEGKQFQGFKDDLLEALDERLQDMRKESRHKSEAPDPARPSLGAPAFRQSSFMMNGPQLDPRLARQMPMVNCNPYGMPPSGIGQMPHGISGLAAAAGKAGFGDDASEWYDMGHADMETTPYMQPDWMVSRSKRNNKGMPRPNVMPHHGAKARGRVAGEDMGMDSSNRNRAMARYSQGMEGRGATMIGRHGNNSDSRGKRGGRGKGGGRLLDSESDDDHDDDDFASSIRSCKQRQRQQQRAGLDRTGRGGGRLGSQDQDMPNRLDFGASPIAKSSISTSTTSSRDRARQARADTDDDAY